MITLLPREVIQSQADGQGIFTVQPIARGVIEDKGIHPWVTLYKSAQEQELIDHVLRSFERATARILTAPLTELCRLPLLSNPGRLELERGPWEPHDDPSQLPAPKPQPQPQPAPKPRTRVKKA